MSNTPWRGAPSPRDRSMLLGLIRHLSLRRGRFVLSSGAISDFYLDLRLTTTDARAAHLSSQFLLQEAYRLGVERVGGPTLGADPLVGAAVALSVEEGRPLRGFLVRGEQKKHGTERLVEGHLAAGDRVLVLDDVVTSAGSIVRAIEAVRTAGAEVLGCFCLVDREGGGREKLAEVGVPLTAVFQVGEVLDEAVAAEPPTYFRPRTPYVTTDAIVELQPNHVLLIKRNHPPYGWALPGGFVEIGESLETAVRRELQEETGLVLGRVEQLHTYSEPGRDPRFHTVTAVFVANAQGTPQAGDDAGEARSFPLDALPADLVFDHASVIEDWRQGRYRFRPGDLGAKLRP
ncbi:MAG: orotate phosphoribosyltransferase [Candidatus Eisenbacteria bacterium]|nr:orotate phosphoribosyltransferase [Candidatus Eisenbacteria bacterium]